MDIYILKFAGTLYVKWTVNGWHLILDQKQAHRMSSEYADRMLEGSMGFCQKVKLVKKKAVEG